MLIRCNECGKEFSDKATACPNCGCPITYKNQSQQSKPVTVFNIDGIQVNMDALTHDYPNKNQAIKKIREITGTDLKTATKVLDDYYNKEPSSNNTNTKKKDSPLSIVAFLITLFGCGYLSVIGLLLAIMDLCKRDTNKNHGWSQGAIGIFIVWVLFLGAINSGVNGDDSTKTNSSTQTTTENVNTELATTEAQIDIDELKLEAQEVTYEDIYRNPETYRDKPIKVTVYVEEYDTAYLGFVEVYYCNINGQDVYVTDYREVKEPTIAKGDTVTIYGMGAGMATLTESQKNIIGLTTDSEKSKIPSIDMYYVEIQ